MDSENELGTVLSVTGLCTYFFTKKGIVKAVDNVSFDVRKGEIMCIVGESGSGKTVTALSLLRLVEHPGRIVEGKIMFDGKNLLDLTLREMRDIRGKKIAMIFQDPHSSLDPVFTIGEQIAEAMTAHKGITKGEAKARVYELLKLVDIPEPERRFHEYPHQFSGGMKQRVMIAMALSCKPLILIADEPTSSLDVTIQALILDMFIELRKKFNMAIIYITHDLWVIRYISDRVAVMYLGIIVESADKKEIFENPLHPYTQALLSSLPGKKGRILLKGEVPSPVNPPEGCRFHSRCPKRFDRCEKIEPEMKEVVSGHFVMCHLYS
ncbi:putative ABC transporter ATP-binding protein [uncultured archaeon]|nr:putative ABC transporter ATP-binding protein [uncultured archaeon]